MKLCKKCGGSGHLLRMKNANKFRNALKRCPKCDRGVRGRFRSKHGRHGPESLFCDPHWHILAAPVVVPASIAEQVHTTHSSVEWTSGEKRYPMLYRTQMEDGNLITRLLPGSSQPIRAWLIRLT